MHLRFALLAGLTVGLFQLLVSCNVRGSGPETGPPARPMPCSRSRLTAPLATLADQATYHVAPWGSDSGAGTSASPWKTISHATAQASPGDVVRVHSGQYDEYVNLNSSGAQVVPITADVSVSGRRVTFPAGTDLTAVSNSGTDFVYVYRSRLSNNGVCRIVGKGSNYVETEQDFLAESGASSDMTRLSAAVGRPVIILHHDPSGSEAVIRRGFYMQGRDWNIMAHLAVRNASEGFNMQNGGNFNLIYDCTVANLSSSNGAQVGVSTAAHPATYNIIANTVIYDPMVEGIYIGAGGQGEANNHTDFTHILDNEIYTSGGSKELENAIDLKEHNEGSVVECNCVHDVNLMTIGNAAVDVREDHNDVLIYNNMFENVKSNGEPYQGMIRNYSADGLEIFNNIFFNRSPDTSSGTVAWVSDSKAGVAIDFYNNTIHNIDVGLMLNSEGGAYRVYNNLFSGGVDGTYVVEYDDRAAFDMKNNLFTADPAWTPGGNGSESGRIMAASVHFLDPAGAVFSLGSDSAAADAGTAELAPARDFALRLRGSSPDIGAYESPW